MVMTALPTPTSQEHDRRWRAVLERDASANGAFVYAVRSTGIYCRPTCPARRPRREQVEFFAARDAAGAGFRACLRCQPEDGAAPDAHADLVRRVCEHIESHLGGRLTLRELGEAAGVSPYHLQRTFKRVMGITPRQFVRARRLASFKSHARNGQTATAAMYEAGYGSSSRLYEEASAELGMTPATYQRGGIGTRIGYTIVDSPLGRLLVAATERGVSFVSMGDDDATLEAALRDEYASAEIARDDAAVSAWSMAILDHLNGDRPRLELPIHVRATAFQQQVWDRLRAIPRGSTATYNEMARDLGRPNAARAVGRACATNPVSIVIPCHRAVGNDGELHGYRWGIDRKRVLLEREAAEDR